MCDPELLRREKGGVCVCGGGVLRRKAGLQMEDFLTFGISAY